MSAKWTSSRRNKIKLSLSNDGEMKCRYCGSIESLSTITIDHIHPSALGGSNDISNLCLSCKSCNSMKRDRSVEWLRLSMALKNSKFNGIINAYQYEKLIAAGAVMHIPEHKFYFEMEVMKSEK